MEARRHRALGTLLLGGTWLWLFAPVLRWLAHTARAPDQRPNVVLLLVLSIAAVGRGWRLLRLSPETRGGMPASVAASSALLYVIQARCWDIDTVSAALFLWGSFGLLGLFLARDQWRAALPGALLFVVALPFGDHLDHLVGFPARTLTASLVGDVLRSAGVPFVPAESILVLENGIADVALPCSGVRGLWTGALFFLGMTWLERRRLSTGWALLGVAYAGGLLVANFVRVLALVVLGVVLQRPELAEVCHVPLGVIGFVATSAGAWALLRRLPVLTLAPAAPRERPRWLLPALVLGVATLAVLRSPHPVTQSVLPPQFVMPSGVSSTLLDLTTSERELFLRHGSGTGQKWAFSWNGLTGSVLVVYSESWRAHHPPEQCLAANGFHVDGSLKESVANGFEVQAVMLNHESRLANYWFQSPERSTPSLLTRIWSDATRRESRWVMVSVLFDSRPADARTVHTFDLMLRASVDRGLRGTPS